MSQDSKIQLFLYKKKVKRGSECWILDAPSNWLREQISDEEFHALGGAILTQNIAADSIERFQGVWGLDKIKLLKRALINKGVAFQIIEIDGACRTIVGSFTWT